MKLAIINNLVKERETPLAILFSQDYPDKESYNVDWIPDNEIHYRKQEDGYYEIHIPVWLARKKLFDYEEKD